MSKDKIEEKISTESKKFRVLAPEFRDAIKQSNREEIMKRISKIALLDVSMRQVLKDDPAVQKAKQALADLMEPYREDLKQFKLQMEFCKVAIDEKGGETK